MATIKLKRGTSAPTTSNIVDGEVAVDKSSQKLYIRDGSTIKEIGRRDSVPLSGGTMTGSLTVGADDTGYDVKFFGATSGSYMLWDESADDLILGGAAKLGVGAAPDVRLHIQENGEPPAEGMFILEANSSSRQLRIQPPTDSDNGFIDYRGGNLAFLDDGSEVARFQGSTSFNLNGKLHLYTTDDQANYYALYTHIDDSFRINYNNTGSDELVMDTSGNMTILGSLTSASLDISGDVDVDGTLEADAITVNGTALSSVIAGTTVDNATLAAKATVTDSTANTNFPIVFHDEFNGLLDDTGALRYNPSTGELLVPKLTVAGTTTTADTVTMQAANAIAFEGATADAYETTLSIVDPTADHTQYLINQGGYIPLLASATTTAITATPEELNILDGVTATAAELNYSDIGASLGTVVASKVVTVDANKDAASFRNITLTGALTAASLDISGDIDVDGTTNLDVVDIDGAVDMASTLAVTGDATFSATVISEDIEVRGSGGSAANRLKATYNSSSGVASFGPDSGAGSTSLQLGTSNSGTYAAALTLASAGGATFVGEVAAASLDISGGVDIDGTTNLDAVDIDGAVQIDSTVTVGVDDTGYDVKFFGATASSYMLWDESEDDLVLAGSAGIDLAGDIDVDGTANLDNTDIDGTLAVDGTTISLDATTSLNIDNSNTSNGITIGTVTSGVPISIGHSTSEVTINDNLTVTGTLTLGSGAELSEAELEMLDGITAGTVAASKAVVVDSNKDAASFRNITLTGELDAATLDISGDADIDGTLETDALSINGTTVTSTAAELNILDGVTSTAAELNILDGVTATTAELNYSDTGSAVGTVVASKVVTVDANKDVASFRNITLTGELDAGSLDISGDVDIDGTTNLDVVDIDGAVDMASTLTVGGLTTLSDNVTANNLSITSGNWLGFGDYGERIAGNNSESSLYFYTDATIALTLDSSQNATFAGEVAAASLDISGNVDIDGTLETDALSINGTSVTSTAAELNILDGVTSTAAELNILDGVTSTTAELNILDGVTSTASELNILDGVTATATELNYSDTGAAVGTVVASKVVTVDANKDASSFRNVTLTGALTAASLDISGDVDIDGTTNLDVVDIDGAVDMASTLAVTGDATFSGILDVNGTDTSSFYALQLERSGSGTSVDMWGTSDKLILGTSATTSALTLDSTNATFAGEVAAASLDISGDVDIDGTLEADAITVNGSTLSSVITGTTVDNATLAATVTVTDSTANTNFPVVFHNESNGLLDDTGALRYNPSTGELLVPNLTVSGTTTTANTVTMQAANAIVFEGATADSHETTLSIVDPTADHTQYLVNQGGYIPVLAAATTTAITATPEELNILDGVTSTASELNILDGVTATAAEINTLDGITAVVGELNALDLGSTAVGTAIASKAVVLDSNKDYTGIRNLTLTGDIDVDGTTNLDVVDIDGAVQLDSTLTVGVDDTGHDVKFFGATAGSYMLWDESTDDLILGGASRLGIGTSSPASALELSGSATADARLTLAQTTASLSSQIQQGSSGLAISALGSQSILLNTNGVTRATIDSGGDATFAGSIFTTDLEVRGSGGGATNRLKATYNSSSGVAAFGPDSGGGSTSLQIGTSNSGTYSTALTVLYDGKVGIGETSPATALDIKGTEASGGVEILLTNVGEGGSNTVPYTAIRSRLNPTRNGGEIRFGRDSAYGSAADADSNMQFYTAVNDTNTLALTLDSSQNATFAGKITATAAGVNSSLYALDLSRSGSGSSPDIWSDSNNLVLGTSDSTAVLTLLNSNATFSGTVTAGTVLTVNAPDGGGSPAMTATLNLHGYEGRGAGIKIKDSVNSASGASDREWFIGTGYSQSGFNIGYASDGSQSSYSAQSKLSIGTDGNATFAGEVAATALDISGDVDIDGTLETDAISINGTTVSATAAELNVLDPSLKENSSIWIGSDPSGSTNSAAYNTALGVNALDAIETADRVTAIGYNALSALTTGSSNTAVGDEALLANTQGNSNIAVGGRALTSNTVGDRNTAVGYQSLYTMNPAGSADMYNTAVGYSAGYDLTVGVQNTLIGGYAGEEISIGNYNTHVGYNAGGGISANAATGDYNTSVGRNALSKIEGSGQANTALGFGTLENMTTASNNVAVGGAAMQVLQTGNDNVAVGNYAGDAITHAGLNTLVGYAAGSDLLTSQYNVAVGHSALKNTTTGDLNIAIGYKALHDNEVGDRNTAIGYEALRELEPSSKDPDMYNVALGFKAGTPATSTTAFTGIHNILLGGFAGAEITSGNYNVAIGHEAGGGNNASRSAQATGNYNVAVGAQALCRVTTGYSNVAVGAYSLPEVTEGYHNVALGQHALDNITTGHSSIAIGNDALYAMTTGSSSIAIGKDCMQAANVTNGATMYNTAVGNDSAYDLTDGTANSLFGHASGRNIEDGDNNTCLAVNAGYNITSGSNNLMLGKNSGMSGSPGGSITTGSNEIVLGDGSISEAHIQVDWTVASDARDKTDFTALDLGLDFVKALKPVTYKWDKRSKYGDKDAADYDLNAQTPDGTHKEDWLDVGFKAQEVEALEIAAGYNKDNKTNLVSSHSDDGKQMGLQYSKFVPILVKAIQEQQEIIEALTARIKKLEGE